MSRGGETLSVDCIINSMSFVNLKTVPRARGEPLVRTGIDGSRKSHKCSMVETLSVVCIINSMSFVNLKTVPRERRKP